MGNGLSICDYNHEQFSIPVVHSLLRHPIDKMNDLSHSNRHESRKDLAGMSRRAFRMSFSDSLSWVFEGEDADAFLAKLNSRKELRPLITGSPHPMSEVRKTVLANSRNAKALKDANGNKK